MDKPTKPTDLIPRSFGGVKNNFSSSLQSSGYEDGVPAIYGGDNLNYQLDATGKELDYCETICDFINAMPIGKTITVDSNNKLVYVDKQELPSQTGNAGKYLTTDGTAPSWTDLTGANRDLSNLTSTGDARLHALKGYFDNGELLTDSEGLADVKNNVHSIFDLSKFTVVGTPTITDYGIASGLSSGNYLYILNSKNFDYTKPFSIKMRFKRESRIVSNPRLIGFNGASDYNNVLAAMGNDTIKYGLALVVDGQEKTISIPTDLSASDQPFLYGIEYDIILNHLGNSVFYLQYKKSDETDYIRFDNVTFTASLVHDNDMVLGYVYAQALDGSIDLKGVNILVDGVEVFSGNKTGIDTYEINGSTVTIPYTLSKTGSKIVDSAYRADVQSVYDEYGYAPYYTLSDTDFTLPQGEIYGMIERNLNVDYPTQYEKNTIVSWGMPDYSTSFTYTDDSVYTAPTDLVAMMYRNDYTTAGGYIYINIYQSDGTTLIQTVGVGSSGGSTNNRPTLFASCVLPKGTKFMPHAGGYVKFYPLVGVDYSS